MTVRKNFCLYSPILLLATSLTAGWSQQVTDSAVIKAQALAMEVFEKENLPGMAVAVWRDDTLRWSEGFGFADIDNKIPADPATSLFRIGSVSKTLTSAGLMLLHQEGKIDLDAPVQKYVESFPEKKYPLTVRQVTQHVAGIRHYLGMEFLSNVHYSTVTDGLEMFMHDTLLFEPGTKYSYSSYGWNLVSAAMETASGLNFLTLMDSLVFTPCEMHHTTADDVTKNIPERVQFYNRQDSLNVIAPTVDNSYKWAGGGFLSTAEDLVRFGAAILSGTILTEETLDESWTPYTLKDGSKTNYGIGWSVAQDKKGRDWRGHGGGSVGGSSMFIIYPEEQLIVVTLVNLTRARMHNLPFRIAEQFLAN